MNNNAVAAIRRSAAYAAFVGQTIGTIEVAELLYPGTSRARQRAAQTLVALDRRGFARKPDPLLSRWKIEAKREREGG